MSVLRRKRRVVLHLDSRTPGIEGLTLEGVMVGSRRDHYALELAKLVRGADETISIDARFIAIPRERVLFVEVAR